MVVRLADVPLLSIDVSNRYKLLMVMSNLTILHSLSLKFFRSEDSQNIVLREENPILHARNTDERYSIIQFS